MRIPFLLLVGCTVASFANAQVPSTQEKGSTSAIVQVHRDSVGANLIKISVLDPKYPVDVLKAQIEQIGIYSGSGSRGIQITDDPIDPAKPDESRLLRGTFAVDGIIDRQGTWLKVAPIAKALAGTPAPHQLVNVQVDFDFEKPTDQDLGDFASSSVDVSRRMVDQSVEYLVHYKIQDPSKIDIPDFAATGASASGLSRKSARFNPDWLIISTVGIAVIAVGALVYCLFLLNPVYRKKYRP